MRIFTIFYVLLTLSSNAIAESNETPNDYLMHLGGIVGFSLGVKTGANVCIESFPELSAKNIAALENWEKQNTNTLNEVKQRFYKRIEEVAEGNSHWQHEMNSKVENADKRAVLALRKEYSLIPPDEFETICKGMPERLSAPELSIEVAKKYALDIVRKIRPE